MVDRIEGADIVVPSGVDADRDLDGLAGALVGPRPGEQGVGRRSSGGLEAEALEVLVAELDDRASAVPAVGRVVGAPPGVIPAQDGAVPGEVCGPCVCVADGDVAEPGQRLGGALDALPFAACVRGGQVGAEDGAEPAGGAELDLLRLAGQGVDEGLASPPAFLAEQGFEPVAERLERRAVGERVRESNNAIVNYESRYDACLTRRRLEYETFIMK